MSPILVRRLNPQDWPIFREVRLRALRGAPDAYGTTAAEAERMTTIEWRERLAARVAFIAVDGTSVVGLACGVPGDRPKEAELISMWVDPDRRRPGVGARRVDVVAAWATEAGFERLGLWVAEGNSAAEQLYTSLGFRRTGEVQPMGEGQPPADGAPVRMEFAMRRELPAIP